MYYSTIHQLEHFADQLEYLVGEQKIDYRFLEISYVVRHTLTPVMARAVGGQTCEYSSALNFANCAENVRRSPYIFSFEMVRLMMGTHNRLLYLPTQLERSIMHPYALNQQLDFNKLEEVRPINNGHRPNVDHSLTPN